MATAKLVFTAITSLDGYVADAGGNFDWSAPDEEVHAFVNDLERPIGTYLLGRRMYDVLVAWETLEADTPVTKDFAQLWRTNWRDAELRRRITVDPHSPGQFRAIGPHVNLQEFYDSFSIKEGAPMWRTPDVRAKIW